ncbi:MAG: four helix bundle protein [Candidatus Sericytochromatia bacterium]
MNHKELNVWKKSIELSKDIYLITKNFPKEEIYGITSQIRRAVVSIASNIAEGSARNSNKEFTHFLYISLGSLSELETQLIISVEIGYIKEFDFDKLEEIIKMLLGLIKYIKSIKD